MSALQKENPMDYRFRPEEEAFRQEVRTFLTSELPPDWDYDPSELFDEPWDFARGFTKRLAPKHKGISYFVTPMDAPGISTRPLVNMADEHVFNEILFDNVRIPARYRVGEENRGWYIGMTTLDFERSNISSAAQYRRTLEMLVEYVKQQGARSEEPGNGAASNGSRDGTQAKLAELAIENQVGRYLSYRVASMQSRGQIPNYESSAAKVYHSEYGQRLAGAGLQHMGRHDTLRET